jgi:hypothetical protein
MRITEEMLKKEMLKKEMLKKVTDYIHKHIPFVDPSWRAIHLHNMSATDSLNREWIMVWGVLPLKENPELTFEKNYLITLSDYKENCR